ncbi:hypothetical protein GCM10009077_24440 [Roseibium denhamense]
MFQAWRFSKKDTAPGLAQCRTGAFKQIVKRQGQPSELDIKDGDALANRREVQVFYVSLMWRGS